MPEPLLIQSRYRSSLEKKVAEQLYDAGVSYEYEPRNVTFTVPERKAKYLADFWCGPTADGKQTIIIEAKGRFGHKFGNGADVRHRLILAKEQNPDLDIRLVFENANLKIGKGSKTTYAKWASDHGFKWSDKGVVPSSWLKEMKGKKR